jgi:hypothetical protein
MNRGCISISQMNCDNCHRVIEDGKQYLLREDEQENKERLCVECCFEKGYASYITEKNEKIISFFA